MGCIPRLLENVSGKYPAIEEAVRLLCHVLCKRVPNILECGQSQAFWQNFMQSASESSIDQSQSAESSSSDETTNMDDEEQPTIVYNSVSDDCAEESASTLKKRRTEFWDFEVVNNCDEMSMKYIFNGNI